MNRKQAVQEILDKYDDGNTLFISTDGLISRELYGLKKKGIFPMVGSMGLAPAIAFGVALNTDKRVIVLNGDGSYLMSKGTQDLINTYSPDNLFHFILDNKGYGTTGGQKRAKIIRNKLDWQLKVIHIENEGEKPPRIADLPRIKKEFIEAITL